MTAQAVLKENGMEIKDSLESLFERGGTTIMEGDNYVRIKDKNIPLSTFKEYQPEGYEPIYYSITDELFIIAGKGKMKTFKIKEDFLKYDWVYSFMKTIVKTQEIKGLRKHFDKARKGKDSAFHRNAYKVLEHQLKKGE